MKKLSIIVPCFNEEQTIQQVVSSFKKVLPTATVYVYDNNSTDHTAQLAEQAGAVVRSEYRQGKGNVVRSMFRDINADCYIMVDGDNTYPAAAAAVSWVNSTETVSPPSRIILPSIAASAILPTTSLIARIASSLEGIT